MLEIQEKGWMREGWDKVPEVDEKPTVAAIFLRKEPDS